MSVVRSKRKLSNFEVMEQCKRIRHEIDKLCARNLGLRDCGKIARKNFAIGNDLNYEPLRYVTFIMTAKENLRMLAYEGQRYILNAMSAGRYPSNQPEAEMRRANQTMAISTYQMILKEFQHVITECNIDVNTYIFYVDMVENEIRLLRAWRRKNQV